MALPTRGFTARAARNVRWAHQIRPLPGRRVQHSSSWVANQGMEMHGTTVLCLQRDNKAVMIADGQVTMGSVVFKGNVKKARRIGKEEDGVIAGFAGGTADALTLFERLE